MAKKTAGKGPKTYRVTIEGVCPMLQNRLPVLVGGGKRKSKAEIADMSANEWKEKAYFAEDIGVYLPAEHIERSIAVAAGNWKLGKKVTATVFCSDTRFPIKMKNFPRFTSIEDFVTHGLVDRRNVKMKTGSSVGRARPMLPTGWRVTVDVMVTAPDIGGDTLAEILEHAGQFVGIGDYRPKFGRFDVVSFEEVK